MQTGFITAAPEPSSLVTSQSSNTCCLPLLCESSVEASLVIKTEVCVLAHQAECARSF